MDVMVAESRRERWWLPLLAGIATLILGLFLIVSPGMTTAVLVTFLGAYWLVRGIFAIVEIFTGASGKSWIWLLALGILGIAAGLIVLRHPLYSAIIIPTLLVLLLGIDAVIMGIVNLVRGFTGDGGWTAVLGIVDLLIGAVLLVSPLTAGLALPVVVGVLALFGGVALIIMSFSDRSTTVIEVDEQRRIAA